MPTLHLNDAGRVRLFNWLQMRKGVGGPYWRMLRRLNDAFNLDDLNDRLDAAHYETRKRLRACAGAASAAEAGSEARYAAEEALIDAKRESDRGPAFLRPGAPARACQVDAADMEMLRGLLKDMREKDQGLSAEVGTEGADWRVLLPVVEAVEKATEKPAEKPAETPDAKRGKPARNGSAEPEAKAG